MTSFDPDLIAALAEGRLSPAEAAAAEARIMVDPAARADLEAQRLALAALHEAPEPRLDDMERARLRRAVAAELDIIRPERQAPARRRFANVPWLGVAAAAAAVVLVIAAAPLLSLLNTSDGADQFDAAATITSASPAAAEAEAVAEAPAATEAPQEEVIAAAPATTAASETTTAATGGGDFEAATDPRLGALAALPDLGTIDPLSFADDMRARIAVEQPPELVLGADDTDDGELLRGPLACAERLLDLRPGTASVIALGLGTLDGTPVEAYAVESGDPPATEILALESATCEIALPVE